MRPDSQSGINEGRILAFRPHWRLTGLEATVDESNLSSARAGIKKQKYLGNPHNQSGGIDSRSSCLGRELISHKINKGELGRTQKVICSVNTVRAKRPLVQLQELSNGRIRSRNAVFRLSLGSVPEEITIVSSKSRRMLSRYDTCRLSEPVSPVSPWGLSAVAAPRRAVSSAK